jgi:hypothetical protein
VSRIIVAKYDNGQDRVVVGWDHPSSGCFWQEFNQEPEDGNYPDDWVECLRFGGYMHGIALMDLRADMPNDLRGYVTDEVLEQLVRDSLDPNSGRRGPIDLSGEST